MRLLFSMLALVAALALGAPSAAAQVGTPYGGSTGYGGPSPGYGTTYGAPASGSGAGVFPTWGSDYCGPESCLGLPAGPASYQAWLSLGNVIASSYPTVYGPSGPVYGYPGSIGYPASTGYPGYPASLGYPGYPASTGYPGWYGSATTWPVYGPTSGWGPWGSSTVGGPYGATAPGVPYGTGWLGYGPNGRGDSCGFPPQVLC